MRIIVTKELHAVIHLRLLLSNCNLPTIFLENKANFLIQNEYLSGCNYMYIYKLKIAEIVLMKINYTEKNGKIYSKFCMLLVRVVQ